MGLLAWLGPIGALLASLLIVFWWIKQRQVPLPVELSAAQPDKPGGSEKTDLRQRLAEELKQFD